MIQQSDWNVGPGYRVYPPRMNMVVEIIDKHVEEGRGDSTAIITANRTYTFSEVQQETIAIAGAHIELGLGAGDRFIVLSRNSFQSVATILAGMRIGAVPVLSHSLLAETELEYIVSNSGSRIAFASEGQAAALRNLASKNQIERLIILDAPARGGREESYADIRKTGRSTMTADTAATDPAFMVYSSGTTGRPKGVVHGHRWVISVGDPNVLQMGFGPDDIVGTVGEFSFMGNFGHALCFPLYAGSAIALFGDRVTPESVLEYFSRTRPNIFLSVPTFYRTMLAAPGFTESLRQFEFRFMISTGEPLGESVWNRWQSETGIPIYEIYGVSEFQTLLSNSPNLPVKPGSTGKPGPGVRVALLDESLNEVPAKTPGILMIHRSDPGLFLEYYRDAGRWRLQHRGDWYYTGDVMQSDEDGYFWYLGRQDDLFKSRGYLISPQEIENILHRHPGVAEAAIIGHPDAQKGNVIVAYVVTKDPHVPGQPLEEDILAFAAQHTSPYKVPKVVNFVDELPKSPVGKILRRALRDPAQTRTSEPA